ncbi:hypothetical protein GDO86_013342 [Hymenochirus boettgeri]|uniref:Uncharacterized protein n=1 Tax=Hymenochirus boettgeri TaxID=247094 RepID=A0A8T2IWA1_9PIPI|nr:hypothetical protein GDO86_013342 [Hymenochirus boettgeri]
MGLNCYSYFHNCIVLHKLFLPCNLPSVCSNPVGLMLCFRLFFLLKLFFFPFNNETSPFMCEGVGSFCWVLFKINPTKPC